MKMNVSSALSILALPLSLTEVYENKLSIRKAYLQAALSSHPDREGGDSCSMAEINAAYQFLKSHVKDYEYEVNAKKQYVDKFYHKNEGHPLFKAGVPALKPMSVLLREVFDIRDSLETMPGLMPVPDCERNHIYFQYDGNDYELFWFGGNSIDSLSIRCISNAGRTGKSCVALKFYVEHWYGFTGDKAQEQIFYLLNMLLSKSPYAKGDIMAEGCHQFSWAKVYNDFFAALANAVEISDSESKAKLFGHELYRSSAKFSRGDWQVKLAGVGLSIYVIEEQAISVFNPFKLDCYKPLRQLPIKLKAIDLIKILANGQFKRLKCHYIHTDDYAADAEVDCLRGFIDNPFSLLKAWVEDRGRSNGRRVYIDDHVNDEVKINFGSYHYELFSLMFDVNNEYPLIDLTEEFERNVLELKKELLCA